MRLAEELPAVDWSDADLINYARGRAKGSRYLIMLAGAVLDDQPDEAEVSFEAAFSPTVRRYKSRRIS